MHRDIDRILFSEEQILLGIERVAADVTAVFRGEEFTVVSVLKGSCIFAADLIRRIPIPLDLAFLQAQSYGSGTTSGTLEIQLMPTPEEVKDRRLLLVDDILDTGRTMAGARKELLSRGAREVRTCAFLDKPARRAVDHQADFRCFEVEDLFVVGYGLDYAGRYRNLPYVGTLRPEVLAAQPAYPGGSPEAGGDGWARADSPGGDPE